MPKHKPTEEADALQLQKSILEEQRRTERTKKLMIEQKSLLADLAEVGCVVDSVWKLASTYERYTSAIPVLLKHLPLPYSDRTKEGIARALAVREPVAIEAWPLLAAEYRKASSGWGPIGPGETTEYRLGAKDGLAWALAVTATDDTLPELVSLAKDNKNGESRVLLLWALKKSKSQFAKVALHALSDDPVLLNGMKGWSKLRTPRRRL